MAGRVGRVLVLLAKHQALAAIVPARWIPGPVGGPTGPRAGVDTAHDGPGRVRWERGARMEHVPLLVIVGPTAVGKSAAALAVAQRLGGEIICADSRTIYRGFDIGTAKPSAADQALVPHHFLDRVDPDEPFTVADFQREALTTITAIAQRGRLPILCGGTGLYVRTLLRGWTIPTTPPDPLRRARLKAEADSLGIAALHARLAAIDPAAAAKIEPTDLVRIVRALEVFETTGRPISSQQGENPPPFRVAAFGLTMPRDRLYERINLRVGQMIEQGWLHEAQALFERYGPEPLLRTLGYGQCLAHLRGEQDLPETIALIQQATRRYAKRQLTWFRADRELQWLDLGECATLAPTIETIASQAARLVEVTPAVGS